MERSEIAIIIPAWNEAKTIGRVIKSVRDVGIPVVVNDCSTDGTFTEAQNAGATVVSHETNKGYDGALNSGFRKAAELGCTYAITFDADGQHDPSLINKFLEKLMQGNDLVLGVRPKPARLAEYLFALYTRICFGIKDPLCGMKGYRMAIYHDRGWFDSYGSIGTELALWGIRSGYKYSQVSVPIAKRSDSPRFGRVCRANINIFRAMIDSLYLKPSLKIEDRK